MNIRENMKYEIFLKLIDKVDYFWNFQYLSTGAIWVFITGSDLHLRFSQKVIFTLIYIAFMSFNYAAHLRGYLFLEAFIVEIKNDVMDDFKTQKIKQRVQKLSYKKQRIICSVVYVILSCITVYSIWT